MPPALASPHWKTFRLVGALAGGVAAGGQGGSGEAGDRVAVHRGRSLVRPEEGRRAPGAKVPHRRRRPGDAPPADRHRRAWRDMEWQMLRILLIFRLIHGIQLAVTVPGIAGHTRHPGRALTLLLAVLAESLWFVLHIFRNHRRVLAQDAGDEPDAAWPAGAAEDAAAEALLTGRDRIGQADLLAAVERVRASRPQRPAPPQPPQTPPPPPGRLRPPPAGQ